MHRQERQGDTWNKKSLVTYHFIPYDVKFPIQIGVGHDGNSRFWMPSLYISMHVNMCFVIFIKKMYWYIDIDKLIYRLDICWYVDMLICWYVELSIYWCIDQKKKTIYQINSAINILVLMYRRRRCRRDICCILIYWWWHIDICAIVVVVVVVDNHLQCLRRSLQSGHIPWHHIWGTRRRPHDGIHCPPIELTSGNGDGDGDGDSDVDGSRGGRRGRRGGGGW
jgi:hypothetical protein